MTERTGAAQTVATKHYDMSLASERQLDQTFSDSISAAVELPAGAGMIGLAWPDFSTVVTLKIHVAESAAGTYRVLRKADGTADFNPFNATSASTAGAIFVSDIAPFKFAKIKLSSALEQTYTFNWIVKH